MRFIPASLRPFFQAVSALACANPFAPGMLDLERRALGSETSEEEPVWSLIVADPDRLRANTWRIVARLNELLPEVRENLRRGISATPADLTLYEDAALYAFYYRYYERILAAAFAHDAANRNRWLFYRDFLREWTHLFELVPNAPPPDHTFACFFQILRAFHHIVEQIIGSSYPAARLRAAVWESVFTHDIRRYRRTLYARMHEFTTLITGPSGTGKELVARSIALSRYIPFSEDRLTFDYDPDALFFPINLAALPGTLIESELFGHKRGAFTGAVADKRGWLEACPPHGAVFLDEIGDLNAEIQVKLLRVIETRTFQPLGDANHATNRRFQGKLIAATNRDLAAAIRKREFRQDFFFRLCSDQIVTPSLREQIDDSPAVLDDLLLFMARRVAGPEESHPVSTECRAWIDRHLDPAYAWPGNYRELEQFVRNILLRRDYQPRKAVVRPVRPWTADELLAAYCDLLYSRTGSYEQAARVLALDRRTVKAKVAAYQASPAGKAVNPLSRLALAINAADKLN